MKHLSILIIFISTIAFSQTETITYQNGAVYTGATADGKREGQGKITYPKGATEANMGEIVTNTKKLSPELEQQRKDILAWVADYWSSYEQNTQESDYNTAVNSMFSRRVKMAEDISQVMGHDVAGKMKPVFKHGLASIRESENIHGEQKRYYYKKLYRVYVESVLNTNPEEGYQRLRHYTGAAYHNREANAQDAIAENIMAESNFETAKQSMEVITTVGQCFPIVSTTLDVVAAGTGIDPVSGKNLSEFERFMKLMMIMAPGKISEAMADSPILKTTLEKFSSKIGSFNPSQIKRVEAFIAKHNGMDTFSSVEWADGQILSYLDGKLNSAFNDYAVKMVDGDGDKNKK
ncbi:Pre-toxin TG [Saccharicrinis carchari]|uniref:Pre-toxin TG n=1 Tax=Saccharicrinis carchari TaxID=1168039 RepID=A0A521F8V2_SACCC|nr:pre-toxin TG domain-containing protein [Saccharicrinis carchari]SMO92645.1 Pre-toxin TG [Saccharicrinis carchari]